VIATGETHSVQEFAELAFRYAGLDYRDYVVTDKDYYRPAEVDLLVGNPAKAHAELGWRHTVRFEDLVYEMVTADCAALGVGQASLPVIAKA